MNVGIIIIAIQEILISFIDAIPISFNTIDPTVLFESLVNIHCFYKNVYLYMYLLIV